MRIRHLFLPIIIFTLMIAGTAVAADMVPQPGQGKGAPQLKSQLDSLVTAGTITQEQENAVLEALEPDVNAQKPDANATKPGEAKPDPGQTMNTKLSSLVSSGVITQAQLDSILAAIKPPEGTNRPGNGTGKTPDAANAKISGSTAGNIVLKVGSGKMTVKGIEKDVDPGYDTTPLIVNGSTFIPVRAVIESLGGSVEWDDSSKKTTITLDNTSVVLQIGNASATVNGVAKSLETLPFIAQSGRVMLPVRFVTENLGHSVAWDGSSQSIIIN
ncbi:MAG: copper amine oxidase N-terminal domain-containing protein [Syntrophomonadaceae bacterium]|nr:copper amine oxidase N-terminal domain-containing protein [Syntrophomonadaceae bacterium]